MNKIQQYNMILETVSPIHIASGNTLNTTQYLYDRAAGKVHFVDEQAWIKFLNERDLLGKFESFVTSSEKGFLYRWLVENKVKENIWYMVERQGNGHPATFPTQLAHDHIISWSNENDIVFDPFLGSGTTGKMAVLNNRNFIGIEKDETYFNIAKKRIKESESGISEKLFI